MYQCVSSLKSWIRFERGKSRAQIMDGDVQEEECPKEKGQNKNTAPLLYCFLFLLLLPLPLSLFLFLLLLRGLDFPQVHPPESWRSHGAWDFFLSASSSAQG